MLSSSTPVSLFQPRYKRLYRPPCVRRKVIESRLRVDHQQVKRHCRIMVEVNDTDSASLAAAVPTPPDLADATLAGIRSPASGLSRSEERRVGKECSAEA